MHFEYLHEFASEDWRIWFQRLGAEASAGAIADMLWKSQRRTNYGRLFELKLGTHLFFWDPDILVAFRGDPPFLVAPNFYKDKVIRGKRNPLLT